ncbi:substrate-binding domain-containing protein [Limnohabitans sp. G3-2]|uniref:helix-turn-helix transcriptional regulator n=1 Tax=Limnohabitans sp. G3-2 TaxID=1100711 RepID=UPI000C1EB772|nr:substrate-binding domain-containing protein [Limnohabitans sp. G3-2]PIT78147.1 LysR family transcriptional regulator [Limnohabitans sp. G3-2]
MQHINLSYSWTPHQAQAEPRDQTSPLRNPLMDMLQAVRATGSIAGAARVLQLSYRHVWGELKRWEQVLAQPLIVWEKGQAARLTEFADKLLWAERQAQARLAPQISALQAELEKTFAVAFDPASHLLTVYASHDDALVKLREHSARQSLHLDMRFCGSVDAIRALNEGRCVLAGFHAPSQPDAHSLVARTYKPLLKTGLHKLIGFASRQQGLMVAKGNPKQLKSLHDLTRAGVRFVNRSPGTGTRLLLDQWLKQASIASGSLMGYGQEEPSHAAVAACIGSGQADAGLGIESAAALQGLDFVPLATEDYWLVGLKSAVNSPAVQLLMETLQSSGWATQMNALAGYTISPASGQIQSLKQRLPWWAHRTHKPSP